MHFQGMNSNWQTTLTIVTLKEPLTEVKKEPEPVVTVPAALPAPAPVSDGEKEEKKSNGAHTPV